MEYVKRHKGFRSQKSINYTLIITEGVTQQYFKYLYNVRLTNRIKYVVTPGIIYVDSNKEQ